LRCGREDLPPTAIGDEQTQEERMFRNRIDVASLTHADIDRPEDKMYRHIVCYSRAAHTVTADDVNSTSFIARENTKQPQGDQATNQVRTST
jgi:hypothetical protein